MENSIDAGSTSISVNVQNGGLSLIEIVDNGSGIDVKNSQIKLNCSITTSNSCVKDLQQVKFLLPTIFAQSAPLALEEKLWLQFHMLHL